MLDARLHSLRAMLQRGRPPRAGRLKVQHLGQLAPGKTYGCPAEAASRNSVRSTVALASGSNECPTTFAVPLTTIRSMSAKRFVLMRTGTDRFV